MSKYNYPKIVVTGLGTINAIGNSVPEFWNAMMAGKSGGGPITRFDTTEYDTKFACEVKNYDPLACMNRKEIQRMDLFTQYALSASVEAVADAGIDFEQTDRERVGVILGSGIGGMITYYNQQMQLLIAVAILTAFHRFSFL